MISLLTSTSAVTDISYVSREVSDVVWPSGSPVFMTLILKMHECLWKVSTKVKGDWIYMSFQTWTGFQTLLFSSVWVCSAEKERAQWMCWPLGTAGTAYTRVMEIHLLKIYFLCSGIQISSNFLWNVNPKLNIFVTMFIFSKVCVFWIVCICAFLYNIMYNYWLVRKYRSKATKRVLKILS